MTPYQTLVIADGAVSYVPGNELTNPLNDIVQSVADVYTGPHPSTGNPAPGALGGAAPGFVSGGSASSIQFPNPFNTAPTIQLSVEMWFNSTDNVGGGPSRGGLLGQVAGLFADINGAGLSDWGLAFYDNMVPSWGMGVSSGGPGTDMQLDAPQGYNDGLWHHVVVTWDGNTGNVKMYVDAVLVASTSGGRTTTVSGLSIWYCGLHFFGWNGLGSNWALYGSALTQAQITSHYEASDLSTCDPVFNDVALLLPCNGTSGSTSFPDASSHAHIVTASGVSVSISAPKFGTGSMSFPAVSATASIPMTTDLDLEHGAWTYECWFKDLVGSGNEILFSDLDTFVAGNFMRAYINRTGYTGLASDVNLQTSWFGLGGNGPSSVSINDTNWHFLAIQADPVSGQSQVWVDGIPGPISGAWVDNPSANTRNALVFGGDGTSPIQGNWFKGNMDDIRITRSLRYAFNTPFTVPAAAFQTIACGLTVPATAGLPLGTAITTITGAGLVVGSIINECSDTIPVGYVTRTNPGAGAGVGSGTVVDIYVADGLCSQTILVYGKFAPAAAYKPVLLVDAKGIKPRIYRPKENTTVKP